MKADEFVAMVERLRAMGATRVRAGDLAVELGPVPAPRPAPESPRAREEREQAERERDLFWSSSGAG